MNQRAMIMQILNSNPVMRDNPIVQNALQMAQNDDREGLKKLAENVANSKGISLNEAIKRFGL